MPAFCTDYCFEWRAIDVFRPECQLDFSGPTTYNPRLMRRRLAEGFVRGSSSKATLSGLRSLWQIPRECSFSRARRMSLRSASSDRMTHLKASYACCSSKTIPRSANFHRSPPRKYSIIKKDCERPSGRPKTSYTFEA